MPTLTSDPHEIAHLRFISSEIARVIRAEGLGELTVRLRGGDVVRGQIIVRHALHDKAGGVERGYGASVELETDEAGVPFRAEVDYLDIASIG